MGFHVIIHSGGGDDWDIYNFVGLWKELFGSIQMEVRFDLVTSLNTFGVGSIRKTNN